MEAESAGDTGKHSQTKLLIFMFWWRIDSDLGMSLKFMMATRGLK